MSTAKLKNANAKPVLDVVLILILYQAHLAEEVAELEQFFNLS